MIGCAPFRFPRGQCWYTCKPRFFPDNMVVLYSCQRIYFYFSLLFSNNTVASSFLPLKQGASLPLLPTPWSASKQNASLPLLPTSRSALAYFSGVVSSQTTWWSHRVFLDNRMTIYPLPLSTSTFLPPCFFPNNRVVPSFLPRRQGTLLPPILLPPHRSSLVY